MLKLAQAHDLHIVEDDTYAHLAPPHLPRLSALDALERTIYVSGFSKILVPNWRVGFLAAPTALVDRFVDTKLLVDADHAGPDRAGAGALPRAGPAAPPRRARDGQARRGALAHGASWPKRTAAASRPRRAACSAGSTSASTPSASRQACSTSWLHRAGRAVPRDAPADDADAHQLRDLAGRALLARAGAGARCARRARRDESSTGGPLNRGSPRLRSRASLPSRRFDSTANRPTAPVGPEG